MTAYVTLNGHRTKWLEFQGAVQNSSRRMETKRTGNVLAETQAGAFTIPDTSPSNLSFRSPKCNQQLEMIVLQNYI